ncbi:(Fe-S)-binding protein [Thermococcus argininiproducens]|uniref:(Fe-S)-binding protein n=1 Tax=Thermococcus argininiproducens TaxID=2866384 RepID=A0A9E7SBV3_9EURY|nr:(Fe-S)-binding protein [Thermococcus argininiproducens]USG99288.1 (Fe-S)-binding protein [Thermococcus argininiproducens]
MPRKWDWLKDEIKGLELIRSAPLIFKFISGKLNGPDDLVKCALCPNMCRHACPISIVDGKETTSPAGKARIAFFIRDGKLELNLENIEPLYMCLSCDACTQWCPFEFSVSNLTRPIKEEAVKKGITFKEFSEVFKNLKEYGYVYGEPKDEKMVRDGNILYLRGCTIREKYPEVEKKTSKVLESLGYKPFTTSEKCCGIPAYNLGNITLFKKLAKEQAEIINSSGADVVVTSCPSCAYAYRVLYPKYSIKINPKIFHITEFLEGKIKGLKTKGRVTFHDPCKLAIGLKRPELLEKLLLSIEGLEVKSPRRKGKETFCCGYGGSAISRLNAQLADEISNERLKELREEAEVIVTACPTCKLAFESNYGKTLDIAELLYDVLRG